jgi:hypothetical protein
MHRITAIRDLISNQAPVAGSVESNATAIPASAVGSDQAHSPIRETATALTRHPKRNPMRRGTDFLSRAAESSVRSFVDDPMSTRESTVLVKFPVITAVDTAPGNAMRKSEY